MLKSRARGKRPSWVIFDIFITSLDRRSWVGYGKQVSKLIAEVRRIRNKGQLRKKPFAYISLFSASTKLIRREAATVINFLLRQKPRPHVMRTGTKVAIIDHGRSWQSLITTIYVRALEIVSSKRCWICMCVLPDPSYMPVRNVLKHSATATSLHWWSVIPVICCYSYYVLKQQMKVS